MSCAPRSVLRVNWLSGVARLGQIIAVGPNYQLQMCEHVIGEYSLAGCVSSAPDNAATTSVCEQVIGEYALAGCVSSAPSFTIPSNLIIGFYPIGGPPPT